MSKNVVCIILIILSIIISGCTTVDSPKTGTILKNSIQNGDGTLTIKNELKDDAIVALAMSNDAKLSVFSVYIRADDSYVINNISENNYILYYKIGDYWNKDSGKFSVTKENSRFENNITITNDNITSVELNHKTDGNMRKKHIYEEDFPK